MLDVNSSLLRYQRVLALEPQSEDLRCASMHRSQLNTTLNTNY